MLQITNMAMVTNIVVMSDKFNTLTWECCKPTSGNSACKCVMKLRNYVAAGHILTVNSEEFEEK